MKKQKAVLLLVAGRLLAQSFTGSILGTIKDATGAVVPQATVVITNTATNTRTEARPDAGGNYIAPLLPPGQYRIEVEAPGFKKSVREGIVLQVQQQARVDLALAVGAVTESIVVAADVPLLETTTSSIGKVVDNRRIRNLPLNTRNVYSLIYLTPGVTGGIGNNYNSLSYSINGARASFMETIVDGITATHPTVQGYSGISVFPSVDAIEEFKVQASNYSAEFGRSAGSVLNVVFKSGSNQLHGSAYEFLRNSVLDANNFFDNRRGQALASFRRSQYGGTVSGPLRRDRTFFMGSYEGLRQSSFSSLTTTVPTLLERQGDFSRTLAANGQQIRIFDPFTTRASGAGFVRDPFTANVVPVSRFDPVAVNAMKYYPPPNAPGNTVTNQQNYYRSGSLRLDTDNYDVRMDHNISNSQKFFARYSHRHVSNTPPNLFPEDLGMAQGRTTEENRARNAVADYTRTLSPTTIFSARLGFARSLYILANQGLGFQAANLGLPRQIDDVLSIIQFPRLGASGYVNLGGGDHRWNAFNTYSSLISLNKILGPHSLKVGFEGRLLRVPNYENRNGGNFNFSAAFTQGPDPTRGSATAGNSIASLLLGAGTTGNLLFIGGFKNFASQSFYYSGYFQDDWRVTSKLTLNLGLRYDLDSPRTERFNRTNYFDPFAPSPLASRVPAFPNLRGGLVFVGVDGRSRHQYPWDRNNWAPRLGLAYQVTPHTTLRASYGHVFAPSLQAAHGSIGGIGFRADNLWVSTLDGITPLNLLRNPYPQGFQMPQGAALGLLTQAGADLQGVLRNTITPWTMQWNFNLQRELPFQVLLEVGYVATRGQQLSRGSSEPDLNQLRPEYLALGPQLNQLVANPFFGVVNAGVLAGPQVSRAQLLRPYPQFTNVGPLYSNGASSNYHSLQTSVSKRFSRGVQFEGSYVWAKNIDDGMSHQDAYNIRGDRTLVDIDIAHRFVISHIWELPFGRGRRFGAGAAPALNFLLGGWQFNGITTFQTGTPLNLTANNTAGLFNIKTRPNNNGKSGRLPGPVDRRLDRYFDTSVFSQPPPFTFGNLAERLPDIRNDGQRSFDLSVFKEFRPVEKLRVEFRTELLNAFNTPRFGNPNTGVTSSSFGVITTQANTPRQIQLGLKLLW